MSDDPNAGFRAELKGIYAEIWDKAHAAGREAGMREAAGIVKARVDLPFYGSPVTRERRIAFKHTEADILSAIGPQEDSTSE